MGSLTSHNPIGLHGLLRDSFYIILNNRCFENKVFREISVSTGNGTPFSSGPALKLVTILTEMPVISWITNHGALVAKVKGAPPMIKR
jgi:hypothetical protein